MYTKRKIIEYIDRRYKDIKADIIANWNIKLPSTEKIDFDVLEEHQPTELIFDNGYFYKIDVTRFENKILFEFIYLGDFEGYYKDWSYKKFMNELKNVCEEFEYAHIYNFELSDEDPMWRSIFLSMMINSLEYKSFNEAYDKCTSICNALIEITEKRLQGIWWNKEFEKDEMLFCEMFLTPYFNTLGFEKVIFNHGNLEFGKDYVLITTNLFGDKEYIGVQVKAGNLSGKANGDINEIINQINLCFNVPYELKSAEKVYMSKVVIAISGRYTNNAKQIILNTLERYKMTNIIFLDNKDFASLNLSNN